MHLKTCAHCRDMYAPLKSDISQTFCTACVIRYRDAEREIKAFSAKYPSCTAAQLIIELKIPAVFVHYMYRLGRFFPELSKRKPVENTPCYFCRRALKAGEDVYCSTCNEIMNQRLHTKYSLVRPVTENETAAAERPAPSFKPSQNPGMGHSF